MLPQNEGVVYNVSYSIRHFTSILLRKKFSGHFPVNSYLGNFLSFHVVPRY